MIRKSCFFIFLSVSVIAWASCCLAAEVYTWTDKDGTMHISDVAPDKPVKLKSVDSFRRGSHREEHREGRTHDVDRVIVENITPQPKSVHASSSPQDDEAKKQKIRERKRREIEDLEARSLRYQQNQYEATDNYYKRYWLEERRKIDQKIEDKKRELN